MHAYLHKLFTNDKTDKNFTAQRALQARFIRTFSSFKHSSMHEELYWTTLLSIAAKERNIKRLFYRFGGVTSFPLPMEYAT